MKDLTKGKPSRLILAFAIPIFMANILQLTYSIVDTRIVGSYLGENSLAAVGATTTLSNLMIGFLMGMAVSYIFIIIAGLVATFCMMHVRRHLGHWAIQLRRLYQAHLRW